MAMRRIGVEAWFDGVALHADGPYLITVADGVIASIAPTAVTDMADTCAPFAIPGLCDAHVHLFLDGSRLVPAERNAQVRSGLPVMLSVARANIDNSLRAGVTLLRDAGDAFGINHAIRRDLKARTDSMVALRSSGAGLRRTGGYGRLLANEIGDACNIAQAVDAAAEIADDIKIILTDIVDFETRRMKGPPQYDLDEMRLIVARARQHGRRTFVHCSGADGLAIAVAAKVDSIEHGYFMNREILKRMADAQIAWVPTFAPVCFQLARPEIAGWSKAAIANLDHILGSHAEHVALAYELGVPIVAGSDAGSPGVPHGSGLIDELHHMCEAGLPVAAVIRSATGEARRHWGMAAASIGAGQQADLVLLETSPFRDPGALREVIAVVKGDIVFNATAGDPAPRYRSRPQDIGAADVSSA
jgi:imidazolonepropionase-like amidohydrolase